MQKRVVILLAMSVALTIACRRGDTIVVGSKNFTESVLLGEIIAFRLEDAGCKVDRKLDLGGTLVCDRAIAAGQLDVYPEYSGTALTAILRLPASNDRAAVMDTVRRAYTARGLSWGPSLGFQNTFAMIVRRDDADRLGLRRVSDLTRVASTFRPGFGYEFVERPDGWHGLLKHYGLTFAVRPQTMDLGLTYRALAEGKIDLIAGNSTDGLIDALGLVVLEDDRRFFPPYDAVLVTRSDIAKQCEGAADAFSSLDHSLDEATMRRLNYEIDGRKRSIKEVAREFADSRKTKT